jgi:hypothetical protein
MAFNTLLAQMHPWGFIRFNPNYTRAGMDEPKQGHWDRCIANKDDPAKIFHEDLRL